MKNYIFDIKKLKVYSQKLIDQYKKKCTQYIYLFPIYIFFLLPLFTPIEPQNSTAFFYGKYDTL